MITANAREISHNAAISHHGESSLTDIVAKQVSNNTISAPYLCYLVLPLPLELTLLNFVTFLERLKIPRDIIRYPNKRTRHFDWRLCRIKGIAEIHHTFRNACFPSSKFSCSPWPLSFLISHNFKEYNAFQYKVSFKRDYVLWIITLDCIFVLFDFAEEHLDRTNASVGHPWMLYRIVLEIIWFSTSITALYGVNSLAPLWENPWLAAAAR